MSVIHPSSSLTVFWINSQRRTHCLSIPAKLYLDTSLGALCVDLALLKKPLLLFPPRLPWHGPDMGDMSESGGCFRLSLFFFLSLCCLSTGCQFEKCAPPNLIGFSPCASLWTDRHRRIQRNSFQEVQSKVHNTPFVLCIWLSIRFFFPSQTSSIQSFCASWAAWRKFVTLVLLQEIDGCRSMVTCSWQPIILRNYKLVQVIGTIFIGRLKNHLVIVYILHLADTFIRSDLQSIQAIHFFFHYVCSLGIEPTTFCTANTMLCHWATGTLV